MQTQIGKWGHSLALCIPRAFAREAQLAESSPVELCLVEGRLVVTPLRQQYRLEDLVAAITPENCHAETDWGAPVGREM
jgi:antitoxin MazE